MKSTWLVTLLILGLATFAAIAQMQEMQEMQEMQGSDSKGSTRKGDMQSSGMSDKARCAYDGMLMKTSAMVPMKHGDATLYFCNEEQMNAFRKHPERYLKKIMIGNTHAFMHVLTIKEYKDMMQNMGMGKMVKIKDPNATHHLVAYLAEEPSVKAGGLAVKIAEPDGKTSFRELTYDKMIKSYVGNVSLIKNGKYKLNLLLASSEIMLP